MQIQIELQNHELETIESVRMSPESFVRGAVQDAIELTQHHLHFFPQPEAKAEE